MTYKEVLENARNTIGPNCKVCPECNGLACGNTVPGPGSKAPGNGANDNFVAWKKYKLEMDTIVSDGAADTASVLFGKKFALPLLAGPVGNLSSQFNKGDDIKEYNDAVFEACSACGVIGTVADGMSRDVLPAGFVSQKKYGADIIPIMNPFSNASIKDYCGQIAEAKPLAYGVVVDSAGLPHLIDSDLKAGPKSVEDLKEIRSFLPDMPFVVKGVLNAKSAEKAVRAGADAIIVSNHGGRVLPCAPATADVLPEIVSAVGKDVSIIVDGGIRSGADILKALALGADAVLICRPFLISWYGGKAEGVRLYIEKLKKELGEAMFMCGLKSISDIDSSVVRLQK